ncbi:MAG TPA: DUF2889 domain-containing protein [Burkholderiaceae bacterium]|nr:DUF2889 domain-containing protein [Burkholderiaceae bacterium]
MPLPAPEVEREALHTRSIRVDAFARADGQWDLEAELIDVKHYDFERSVGVHKAGEPVHHMRLRVTFDESFTITAARAGYEAAPYGQYCMAIESAYQDLVGMNLLKGFRDTVKRRFGKVQGCTHMTELSYVLPTVAVQALSGKRREEREAAPEGEEKRPFQLEGCHALRLDGPVAKEFYPKWYVTPVTRN